VPTGLVKAAQQCRWHRWGTGGWIRHPPVSLSACWIMRSNRSAAPSGYGDTSQSER